MARLLKNNRKIKIEIRKKLFFTAVVLLLILAFCSGTMSFLSGPLQFVGRPIWKIKNYSVDFVSELGVFFKTKEKLREENKILKNKLGKANFQLFNRKALLEENIKLKEILGRKNEDFKFILANVIAKPNLSPYDSLILDRGSQDGVKKGNKVLADADIIIGEIAEIYSKTSKAKLYSFPRDTLNVALGFDKIFAQAVGKGGGNFELKLPQGTPIALGDLVTLPEMGLLVLGRVEEIDLRPEDPFQTVLFKSPVNIFELRWVQILQE
ncbi:MAG: rod shape-determining protein MreC [Candidatus Pacebacteria bacterium]|nr:rod shape-determining protein MreC [Candidatus Paceibacterota bacterium]